MKKKSQEQIPCQIITMLPEQGIAEVWTEGKEGIETRPMTPEEIEECNKPKLPFSVFLSCMSDGGLKCPLCGRYAKSEQLGWVGAKGNGIIVDAYGHLPGFGCNKEKEQKVEA